MRRLVVALGALALCVGQAQAQWLTDPEADVGKDLVLLGFHRPVRTQASTLRALVLDFAVGNAWFCGKWSGAVKEVTFEGGEVDSDGKPARGPLSPWGRHSVVLDRAGRILSRSTQVPGRGGRRLSWSYTQTGAVVALEELLGDRRTRFVISYDQAGRRTQGVGLKYTYDSGGRLAVAEKLRKQRRVVCRWVFAYKDGGAREARSFFPSGKEAGRVRHRFDDKGRLVEEQVWRADRTLLVSRQFTYSASGGRYQVEEQSRGVKVQLEVQNGMLASKTTGGAESLRVSYNEKNDPTSYTDPMGKCEVEYEYDRRGNWTKRTQFRVKGGRREPFDVAMRSIRYWGK